MSDQENEGAAPEQTPNKETVTEEVTQTAKTTTEEQAPEGTSEEAAQEADKADTLGGTGTDEGERFRETRENQEDQ